jgi:hypothetical protein
VRGGGQARQELSSSPRLDFSIGFADKSKSRGITLLGIEKGPLPRMQKFFFLMTEKKSCGKLKKIALSRRNFYHLGAGNLR